ncbi:MAG: thiolase family protein [Rubrobacteraceae bacterium]
MSFGNGNGNGDRIVISTPLRTAIGTFGGALKDTTAVELGSTVGKEVLSRAGIEGDQVDQAILGNILMAGQGMNPGRQVGMGSGLPVSSPGMTLNRMCASGLQAIVSAAQEVALGDAGMILAGGIENMDQAPFLLPKGRYGYRMGMPDAKILDHMVYDGLWDVFENYHMGTTAENVADKYKVSREDADAYAVRSHQRAAKAIDEGYFEDQIVPIEVKQKKETVQFTKDEHVRPNADMEGFAKLRPAFKKDDDATTTAGNSSGINDGAGLMLVTNESKAQEMGVPVDGFLVSAAVSGVDPSMMGTGMIPASQQALKKAGISIDEINIVEANEAFATVAVTVERELGVPEEKMNPLGGAVALGHPIGATGAILTVKILHELKRTGGRYGLVTLCVGGGMGIAAVFENPDAS